MEAGIAPPPGGADGGAPSHEKELVTQLLTKYKATNVRKGKQGLRLQKRRARKGPSRALRRRIVPGAPGARWVGGGVGHVSAAPLVKMSQSQQKSAFFLRKPASGRLAN